MHVDLAHRPNVRLGAARKRMDVLIGRAAVARFRTTAIPARRHINALQSHVRFGEPRNLTERPPWARSGLYRERGSTSGVRREAGQQARAERDRSRAQKPTFLSSTKKPWPSKGTLLRRPGRQDMVGVLGSNLNPPNVTHRRRTNASGRRRRWVGQPAERQRSGAL
jgi:hypothetical protein